MLITSQTPSTCPTRTFLTASTADPVESRLRRQCLMPGCRDDARDGILDVRSRFALGSAAIALENLALRHQLLVLQRSAGRPRLARWDRVFWVWLSRVWVSWRSTLVIVQPATVLAWHRQDFLWFMSSDLFLTPQLLPRHRRQVILLVIWNLALPHDKDDFQPLRA